MAGGFVPRIINRFWKSMVSYPKCFNCHAAHCYQTHCPFTDQASSASRIPGGMSHLWLFFNNYVLDWKHFYKTSHHYCHQGSTPSSQAFNKAQELWLIWKEYEFVIDVGESCKRINNSEKRCQQVYLLKKEGFWDVMKKMIANGHKSYSAVDKIDSVYGRENQIQIISRTWWMIG